MELRLEKPDELAKKFFSLKYPEDVAHILGVAHNHLVYYLYILPESSRYRSFEINKKNNSKRRIINAPASSLKIVQQKLNQILQSIYSAKPTVHGFVYERSVLTNAKLHVGKRFVFNVDLEDFFPSINFGRVRGMFMAKPYALNDKVATVLAQICCHDNQLPQGAPTSPIVANMVCARLDSNLQKLAKEHYCMYSRYADDITFSKRSHTFPTAIGYFDSDGVAVVGAELKHVIEANGFKINDGKVRQQTNKTRQSVTGLIVNRKANLPRNYIRQIRAMIHAWDKFGYEAAEIEHANKYYAKRGRINDHVPPFSLILRGKLEYLRMIKGSSDPAYKNLQKQLAKVDKDYRNYMIKENEKMSKRDAFISHASEDKDSMVRPLAEELIRIGFSIWYDEYELTVGDSLLQKIDDGLTKSRYGIVVLSKHFFEKDWPKKELDGLTAKEMGGQKVILPIWHNISKKEITKASPILAGRVALLTKKDSIPELAQKLGKVLKNQ